MCFRQTVLILFILITLSNCAVMEPIQPPPESEIGEYPPSTRPTYNLSGYPTAMKDGYIDGCETAKDTPYGKKNENRYDTDGQYRLGWDDGFDMCQEKTAN